LPLLAAAIRSKQVCFAVALYAGLGSPPPASAQDPAVYYISGAALLAMLPAYLLDTPQPDADRSSFKVTVGDFDAVDDENRAIDLWLEHQPGKTWHRIKPLFGLAVNTDGSFYGWVAGAHDFHIAERFVVKVSAGPAFYVVGEEAKSLGSPAVLRSGFEVGYRFSNAGTVTTSFHHMSHGYLLNRHANPGTETIAINFNWSLGR
jgi:hypothetical protein